MDSPSPTVLIVDGMPANREQYRLLLLQHQHSYTILDASLGMQGLNLRQQQQPDVILLGYPLPDLDDLTFLSQLQLLTNQLYSPVILLIEQSNGAIAARAIAAGAQTYLVKEQLTAETLRIAIDSTITTHQLRQQLQQREAALQESKEQLKSTLEATRTGLWEWNIQTGKIQWSDNLEPLFGLEPGEFDGSFQMFAERLHPDDRDRVLAAIDQAVATGDDYDIEFRIVYPNGRIRWALSQGKVFYNKDGQPVRMVGHDIDITKHKRAEEQLRESEERFRTSVETLLDCFAVYRAVRNQQGEIVDFQAEYINDAACRTSQIPKEQHLSRGLCELLPGQRDSGLFAEYCQVVETGQPLVKDSLNYEDEFGQQRLTKAFDIRIAKFGDGYIATWRDITDRKQAEQRLQDYRKRSEAALRENEARQAYLLRLSDVLRSLADPVEIQETATQTAMNHFEADRCYYCEIEDGNAIIRRDAARDGLPTVAGVYPLSRFTILKSVIEAGHPFVVQDVHTTDTVDNDLRQICIQLQVISYINVPVIKNGKPVGVLCLVQSTPRDWTHLEVELAVETADRTWAAVERGRAEVALRESEERNRTLFESIDEGVCLFERLPLRPDGLRDYRYVAMNPAMQAMFGIPDLSGQSIRDNFPNEVEDWYDDYDRVLETGQPIRFERESDPQGMVLEMFVTRVTDGSAQRLLAVMQDVTERKRSEQRLQESEQKLGLFVKYAPVSVAMFDRSMHYLAVSQRWIDEYHLGSIEAVLGRSHYEIFPFAIPDHWRQAHQRGLAGSIEKCDEDCILLSDGSWQWLRWEVHPWYSGTKEVGGIFIFSENTTPRKQAEVALRESEQMLRLALTGAGQGIWDWNLETQILTWDRRCKEIFGLPSDLPVTYEWHLEALHPDDRQRVQESATMALQEHTEFVEEYRTSHPNGTLHWILARGCGFYDATGKPYRMSGTVMDITTRKQAEIDLQERNEHIRLLYETTRDLLSTNQPLTLVQSVFEDLKALIGLDVYFNYMVDKQQQTLHLTAYDGISVEQAEEIEWLDLGVAICGTVAQQRRQIMQVNLQQSTDPKAELVRSLGLTAYCAQPLIAQDKLYGTLSFGSRSRLEFTPSEQNLFQAICDQIAIALERSELFSSLQQQTEELIRANCVKDEFLAILSHELRSPLNPILGWAKLLQTRTFDAAKTANALATIERNARLQTQLIDDLLDVAKILRGKLSLEVAPVDLVFVIESAIDTVRTAAIAKNIDLHLILPQIGRVSGDATRLQQVVWNLLSNAVKFTPNGGRVEVELALVTGHSSLVARQMTNDNRRMTNYAQVTVRDTGKGIKPDFLPYIFESFRQEDATTTRQYGGLGLGLSIVRHLVEAHGGTIRVESPGEGQGTTFKVRLPLLELEPDRGRSEELWEELDLTGVRVLAVDDEPDARELLSVLLSQYGAEVLTVNSAADMLAHLESFQPDILISDIGMPQMDGFALIQHIRALPAEKGGQTPAIALTAYAREEDYQQAIANGYQRHVTKPLDPEQLVRAVMVLVV